MRFTFIEFSGGLGDLGTFLPLSIALALTCDLDLGLIFIFAGLMHIMAGFVFGQPIPVQPMKAIAAVAIAVDRPFTAGEIAASGIITGLAVIVLALVGAMTWIARVMPRSVVYGIQAGLGIKLIWAGAKLIADLEPVGYDSWLVAGIAIVLAGLGLKFRRLPMLIIVVLAGLVLMGLEHPDLLSTELTFQLPRFTFITPTSDEWLHGLTEGAIPQIPLTLLNSVIAICVLSETYFPTQGASPKRMAISVGAMNLLCVPFGGMPMCHGAGGLAAQYGFGARTGGSMVMVGVFKIAIGVLIGSALLTALDQYPQSILAMLIIFAGGNLALTVKKVVNSAPDMVTVAIMTGVIMWTGTFYGFLAGLGSAAAVAGILRVRRAGAGRN
jgi:MFS superfamily sulfate permease-like transporter